MFITKRARLAQRPFVEDNPRLTFAADVRVAAALPAHRHVGGEDLGC
jgi:hypothetical protein